MQQVQESDTRELLTDVIRALVDVPGAVRVEERRSQHESHMIIDVSPRDRGKIVGKRGATVQSLRVLFGRIAAVEGRKIFINLSDDYRFRAA